MRRYPVAVAAAVLVLAGCGDGTQTLSEYSEEVTDLILTFDAELDAEAEEYSAIAPDVEGAQAYFQARVDGYRTIVDDVADLRPPDEVVDLHDALQEILGRLLETEEARAEFADTISDVADLDQVWEGAEAQAVLAAEQEAIVLCYAAQEQFDDTAEREGLQGVPWMPPEMKEVVRVALNCP